MNNHQTVWQPVPRSLPGNFTDDVQPDRFGVGPIADARIEVPGQTGEHDTQSETQSDADGNIEAIAQGRRGRRDDHAIERSDGRACAVLREDYVIAQLQDLD